MAVLRLYASAFTCMHKVSQVRVAACFCSEGYLPVNTDITMRRKLMRYGLCSLIFAVAVTLALDLLYFARGSLELFPSPEDHAKVRSVTGIIAALLIGIEVILWRLLRRVQRSTNYDEMSRSVDAA